jgi:hypothetical protein
MAITDYSGSNKVLKILYESKGEYDSLSERLDAIESGAGGAGVSNQLTKLGVVASEGSPYVEDITIEESPNFLVGTAEVLKFVAGAENQVQVLCSFDNGDASSFEANDYVEFDGTMHLKTSDTFAMTDEGNLGDGKVFSYVLDKTLFNTVSISIS